MSEPSLTGRLRETLAVVERAGEPLTTPEVAARLDLGRRSTYDRLERLSEQGRLETKKVGANARVWWCAGVTDGTDAAEPAACADRREFESLVDAVEEYAIFSLDPDGRVRSWNTGAERIKGYAADEIVGDDVGTFYTTSDRANNVPERNLLAARRGGSIQDEGWRVRADGTRFWASVTITALRDDAGDLQGYLTVIRDVTDRREQERRLREERDLTDQLVETVPVRLVVFDTDGSVERINSQAKEALGVDDRADFHVADIELVGEDGEPVEDDEHPFNRVVSTGDPVRDVLVQHRHPDGDRRWISIDASPVLVDGTVERVVVAGTDVTELVQRSERVQRQRDEIERELRTVYERVDDAFFALDGDWRFTHLNDRACELLDRSESALLGDVVWDAFPEAVGTTFQHQYEHAIETQESVTFEEYFEPLDTWFEVSAYPAEDGLSVYFRDVTDRKESALRLRRARRRLRTLVDNFPNGAVALVDRDCRYVTVGGDPLGGTDGDPAALEGMPVREALPPQLAELFGPGYEDALDGNERTFQASVEGRFFEFRFLPIRDDDGEVVAAMGMSQDVTDHVQRKRELERRVRQQEVVAALGQQALEASDVDELMADAAATVAETLRTDYCKVLDLDQAADELSLRQGVGWRPGIVAEATVSAVENDSQAAYTLASAEPVVVSDLTTEARFSGPALLTDHDVRSGISTVIGPLDDPWGILGTHDTATREFSQHDVNFVQSVANILAAAVARHEDQQMLRQQREQMAAVIDIEGIVRDITDAVITQSSREKIERTVVERLAGADSYAFAWIGEVDTATRTVVTRVEAGVEGYLDGITISVDPEEKRGQGPTGRAFRTGEMQVCQDIRGESQHDPWRGYVEQYDVESSAAVPIVHEGTVYGVLNVYATRAEAFDDHVGVLFEQLGEVVGHAIAANERKQALMSDAVVELAFRIPQFWDAMDIQQPGRGRITIDEAVCLGDDAFILYGSVTRDALPGLRALAERTASREALSVHCEEAEESTYELRVSEPPVLSTVASLGGAVEETVIDGDDCRLTVHLSPTADVRKLIDAIERRFPTAKLFRRRQTHRDEDSLDQGLGGVTLTDRQRAALEAAYHSGFFEWPRGATGEEVAEAIGIAPSTFHQHLRKAEQRVFGALVVPADESEPAAETTSG